MFRFIAGCQRESVSSNNREGELNVGNYLVPLPLGQRFTNDAQQDLAFVLREAYERAALVETKGIKDSTLEHLKIINLGL